MEESSKQFIQNLAQMSGEARGVVFQTDKEYVLLKWGKDGLTKLKNKSRELGMEMPPYETASAMGWYPISQRVYSLLLIKETFHLTDEAIREIGAIAPKFSFIVKILFKLFTPIQKFAREIPRYWEEHYTIGVLEVKKVSEREKEMVLHLKNIKLHPILCEYLEGYFEGVFKFIYPNTVCQEVKCEFKGDTVHEYRFNW